MKMAYDIDERDGPALDLRPMATGPCADDDTRRQLLELQLKMATSSVNHEYARIEFDDERDEAKREELLDYMHECRCKYFEARSELKAYDPYALADFEADLMRQKQVTISGYEA